MAQKKIATRDGFGEAIVEAGKANKQVCVVDIDIGKSCKTTAFRKELPEQYINVGIAEQNGAGVAAGMATCGKIPFVVTYAAFGSMRICEMIRQEICYPNLNVKIACSHGGLTPANDGASHQAIEDMGIMRTLPNMTVIMPADYYAAKALVKEAAETYGPMYLRFTRDAIPVIYDENTTFTIGKANLLKEGKDVLVLAFSSGLSTTYQSAVIAAQELEGEYPQRRIRVVDTLSACLKEFCDCTIGRCGLEKFYFCLADFQECCSHFLLFNSLDVVAAEAKYIFIVRKSLFDTGYGNAEVFDF